MPLTHNSKTAEREPSWGSVDKTKLPRNAHADTGEAGKKSTWGFPHHWVKDGGDLNDDGVYASGTMYLHQGGLNAAWSAAQGGRSGQRAPAGVRSHLQAHRRALGLEKSMSDEATIGAADSGKDEDKGKTVAPQVDLADEMKILTDRGKATVSKSVTYHRFLEENYLESKANAPGAKFGYIEGYASVFDVVDHQGEVVRRGAFAKSIAEQDGKIVLSVKHFAHGGNIEHAVATVVDLKEDDYGLKFRANWHGDEASQFIRNKVKQLLADDVKVSSSIGYRQMQWKWIRDPKGDRSIVELTELALKEITLTLSPANDGAVILDAKSKGGKKPAKTSDGAGSSDADDGQAPVEPQVAEVTAAETGSAGTKPVPEETVLPTVDEADTHSAHAKALSLKARILGAVEKARTLRR